MVEVINEKRLEELLKEYLKDGITTDVNDWIDEIFNSARNGYEDFEISKSYTKDGLPHCVTFVYEFFLDEDGNVIKETIEL